MGFDFMRTLFRFLSFSFLFPTDLSRALHETDERNKKGVERNTPKAVCVLHWVIGERLSLE